MFKTIKKTQSGFTIIELLIVIAIIIALAMLVLNNFQGAQAKARDTQRVTDINTLHSKLEEFYNDNSYYPGTFTPDDMPGVDAGAFTDPTGDSTVASNSITMNAAVADEAAAIVAAAPAGDTATTASYIYVPYPTGCTNDCTGYVLGTYIERESTTTPNPYIKKGLNNE